jgi:hypothetical protein
MPNFQKCGRPFQVKRLVPVKWQRVDDVAKDLKVVGFLIRKDVQASFIDDGCKVTLASTSLVRETIGPWSIM